MAPAEAATLPAAEAIVIADEAARAAGRAAGESKLKILPPYRETPIGLLRLEADVAAADHARSSSTSRTSSSCARTQPPYSVEIDLGEVPRRQTVRAVGYDASGQRRSTRTRGPSTRATRAWRCKILPAARPGRGQGARQGGGPVDRRRRRQAGRALPRREEDQHAGPPPPYEVDDPVRAVHEGGTTCARPRSPRTARRPTTSGCSRARARRSRACAWTSSSSTSPRSTRTNHFVKGLSKDDFAVQEDGTAADDDRLRGRREPAADDRPRRGRLGLDGEVDALRARRGRRALQEPDPREGPGLRHRVSRPAPDASRS